MEKLSVSSMVLVQLAAALFAFLIATLLIPAIIRYANKHRILDYPDSTRHHHREPVPRLGGVALFASVGLTLTVVAALSRSDSPIQLNLARTTTGVILGVFTIGLTGLVDDLWRLNPTAKILAQSTAALMVVAYGFRIETVGLTESATLALGFLSVPVTILWLISITNAFNIIDGVDGLASSLAIIALVLGAAVDLHLHGLSPLLVSVSMIGALIAFLRYNKPPATIFLGDVGSMSLGFYLAISLVQSATTNSGVTIAPVPLIALAYPLTDMLVAIARRWIRGSPISRADMRHIHHQLLALGFSPAGAVVQICALSAIIAIFGSFLTLTSPHVNLGSAILLALAAFGTFCYGMRWLQYGELTELGATIATVARNARRHIRAKVFAGELAKRVSDATSLAEVRNLLASASRDLDLLDIALVDGPLRSLRPGARHISPADDTPYRVEYPIVWLHEGQMHKLTLRLWAARQTHNGYSSAESIGCRIAPAVERWMRQNTRSDEFTVKEQAN